MTEDKRVGPEVAKLASEKGYLDGSTWIYQDNQLIENKTSENNVAIYINGLSKDIYEAPLQSSLQTWLRNQYKIVVVVDVKYNSYVFEGDNWECKIRIGKEIGKFVTHYGGIHTTVMNETIRQEKMEAGIIDFEGFYVFPSYEEALEAGLLEALKIYKRI